MGKYFSNEVEKAVEDLYYCYDIDRAREAEDVLAYAATEEDDGDACYFLSRCFTASSYRWKYQPFQENDAAVYTMLRKGAFLGSEVAVLGALRMGMLTPELQDLMPFSDMKEVWKAVLEKAESGCLFCQCMIGDAYYYLDTALIEDMDESRFESPDEWNEWRREQIGSSTKWYEKAFEGGMGIAGHNLWLYYHEGREELLPPDEEKAQGVIRRGAELGYPDWIFKLAQELYDADQKEEGLSWAIRAGELGHADGWRMAGDAYWDGEIVERNPAYALECYEKCAAYVDEPYVCSRVGAMYFCGRYTRQDYHKAAEYLEHSYAIGEGKDTALDMLGVCCLLGYGCEPDPVRAKALLEAGEDTKYKNYGLGVMYAEGLGVPEDIEKGVTYLLAAGDYEPAREELKNYKKRLFGGWKRR